LTAPSRNPISKALFVLGFSVLFAAAAVAQDADLISTRPPGEGPTRVEVGFYIIDLMKVIDVDEAFEADVFLLARWQDSRLAGNGIRRVPLESVWTPNVLIFNQRAVNSSLPKVVTIQADGTVVYRQRLTGTFASRLNLRRFPLDSQTLQIRLVAYGTNTSEVELVAHSDLGALQNPEFAITDWKIGPPEIESGSFEVVPTAPKLPMLTIRMGAERLTGYYIVQLLIPLLLILGMSWVVFLIDPGIIPTRVGTCVTTVLTLIAYRFMISGFIPKLPYLTVVDYVLLGATLLVAASLVTVALTGRLVANQPEVARRVNRIARVVHPSLLALLLLLVRFAI
jgi:hypothetical protein